LRRDGIKREGLRISLDIPSNEVVRSALASGQLGAVLLRAIERPLLALLHRQRRASFALRAFDKELSPMRPTSL
jgi:hypothetical protein